MRPSLWPPPVDLSTAEHAIIKHIRRATSGSFGARQLRAALDSRQHLTVSQLAFFYDPLT